MTSKQTTSKSEHKSGGFTLDFSTFLVKPNPNLTKNEQSLVWDTINVLKLNTDEDLIIER